MTKMRRPLLRKSRRPTKRRPGASRDRQRWCPGWRNRGKISGRAARIENKIASGRNRRIRGSGRSTGANAELHINNGRAGVIDLDNRVGRASATLPVDEPTVSEACPVTTEPDCTATGTPPVTPWKGNATVSEVPAGLDEGSVLICVPTGDEVTVNCGGVPDAKAALATPNGNQRN